MTPEPNDSASTHTAPKVVSVTGNGSVWLVELDDGTISEQPGTLTEGQARVAARWAAARRVS